MKKILFWIISLSFIIKSNDTKGQVNLQTGAAQFSIPLCSYSDINNKLETGVSLIYTAGNGLKVNEIPSSVGTGWELQLGGYIQRIQHGEPDDQKNNDTYSYPTQITNVTQAQNFLTWVKSYYPNGYLYSEYSSSQIIDNGAAYTPLSENSNFLYKSHPKYQADREQDVFSFSFNGKAGYFVISKPDQNGLSEIRTLYDSKLKIEKVSGDLNNSSNIRTTISEFIITDENGIKYYFRDANLSEICDYDKTYLYDKFGNATYVNGDHAFLYSALPTCVSCTPATGSNPSTERLGLTAIKGTPKNQFLKSQWLLSEIKNPMTNKKIIFEYESIIVDVEGETSVSVSEMESKTNLTLSVGKIRETQRRIKKIILSAKESVEFQYSLSNRIDLGTDNCLDEVIVKYDGQVKYSWSFEYGYFVKNLIKEPAYIFSDEEKKWARLCLKNVKRKGINLLEEPPYKFDYYLGNADNLNSAVPPIFTFQHDLYGYYNPSTIGFYSPTQNSVSGSNPPYEPFANSLLPQSMYYNRVTQPSVWNKPTIEGRNGILKSYTNPLGGMAEFIYEQNENGSGIEIGGVRVKKVISYDGQNHSNDQVFEYKYLLENGLSSGWAHETLITLQNDPVRIYKSTTTTFPGVNLFSIGLDAHKLLNNQVFTLTHNSSGFKMKSSFGSDLAYGIGMSIATSCLVNFFIALFSSPYHDYVSHTHSLFPLNGNNRLPFQYSRTEVIHKLGNDNIGKEAYEFTSPNDYSIDFPVLLPPYSSKQRLAYWQYGLLKKSIIYDRLNNIIQKTENSYTPIKYTLQDSRFLSQKWTPNLRKFEEHFAPFNDPSSTDIISETYFPICGRIQLSQSKEYSFNNSNEFKLTTTDYEYDPFNYLPKKILTTNSKGEVIENIIYYPYDYTLGGPIQVLKDNNIINVPISSQTFITKGGNQKYLLKGSVSQLLELPNGDIKVNKTYSLRSAEPVISTLVPFISSQLIPNPNYYKETGTVVYNTNGTPVQVNSENGIVSTIYDYDNTLPVATVINASIDDIAYASFETESVGGWSIVLGSTYLSDKFKTGKKSLSGGLSKTLTHPGNYTITLWSHSTSSVTVNNQSGTLLTTLGDWKLYEWKLNNISSVQVVGGIIDDVRLYPSVASMNTITYDPIFGKTSESDNSNRIIYYEYDGLGRLRIVRDEEKNVLKTYEYNYKQQ